MPEAHHHPEPIRRRISDEPFSPQSVADLREELGKAGLLSRRKYGTRQKEILYTDDLIARLVDEHQKGLRDFYRVRYEGDRRTTVESGMKTFRGKMFYTQPEGQKLYMVQCAGSMTPDELAALGTVDPKHLPAGWILKQDSSTSGKLPVRGLADPEDALHRELNRQLGVTAADYRMLREPVHAHDERVSPLFAGLRTRFDNITYFLEMLTSGFKPQYVQRGPLTDSRYPLTVSTWIPA